MKIDFSLRISESGVDPLFIERWSPRGFQAAYEIDHAVLTRIFDAARWAPSCFNEQPWTFVTSTKESFKDFLPLLVESNQVWAQHASIIGFAVGDKHFEKNGKNNQHFQFDAGAAWMSLCLQARKEDLYAHGMGGIKFDAINEFLSIDTEKQQVLMGFVIGKLSDRGHLSVELQQKEKPSARKSLQEIWKPK